MASGGEGGEDINERCERGRDVRELRDALRIEEPVMWEGHMRHKLPLIHFRSSEREDIEATTDYQEAIREGQFTSQPIQLPPGSKHVSACTCVRCRKERSASKGKSSQPRPKLHYKLHSNR